MPSGKAWPSTISAMISIWYPESMSANLSCAIGMDVDGRQAPNLDVHRSSYDASHWDECEIASYARKKRRKKDGNLEDSCGS